MSGIFGILDSTDPQIGQLLSHLGAAMAHREWFVVETHQDEQAGVGLGRIGIGVFNRERQPLCSEDGNLVVFLSGKLYDTAPIRLNLQAKGHQFQDDTDSELVLRLYQEKGEHFIHDLNGEFVLAIWDHGRGELTIANDRFGLYPLYYAHRNGRLIFAPEMKGILCDPRFPRRRDMVALAEYMRFQHLLGDRTFFEELKLLTNATLMRYHLSSNQLTLEPYWDISCTPELPTSLTFEDAVDEAGRLLKEAVKKRMAGNYRFGVYLSGGLDSRTILGLIDRDRFPITSITFGQRHARDVMYAQALAAKAGTRHFYFEFRDGMWVKDCAAFHLELTEGFHSWIHSHGTSILDQVRPLVDVNLSGFGAEQARIAPEDLPLVRAEDDIAFTNHLFHLLGEKVTWPSIGEGEERFLYTPQLASQMHGLAFDSLRLELARYGHLPYLQRYHSFYMNNCDRRLYQYYIIFNRSSIEQCVPFCDYQFAEIVYALPPDMLLNDRLRRAIILKMASPLAQVPYDKDSLPITNHDTVRLGAKLIKQSKACINRHVARLFPEYAALYADYEGWLRHELRDWGESILLGKQTLQRGIFNPDFLHSMWRRHQSGLEVNIIGKIAPIMTYEMMLRRFDDHQGF